MKSQHLYIVLGIFLLFLYYFFYKYNRYPLLEEEYVELSWEDLPVSVRNVYEISHNVEYGDSLCQFYCDKSFFDLDSNRIKIDLKNLERHGLYPIDYDFYIENVVFYVETDKVRPPFIFYKNKLYLQKFKAGYNEPKKKQYFKVFIKF